MLLIILKKFPQQFSFQAIVTTKSNKGIKEEQQYSLNIIKLFLKFSLRIPLVNVNNYEGNIFFFYLGDLLRTFTIHRTSGEEWGSWTPWTPLYHLHSLHRHLDISRAITVDELTSAYSLGNPWFSERKWLTTKLRALKRCAVIEPLEWWILVRDQRNP